VEDCRNFGQERGLEIQTRRFTSNKPEALQRKPPWSVVIILACVISPYSSTSEPYSS
jgi:hypothetical protein